MKQTTVLLAALVLSAGLTLAAAIPAEATQHAAPAAKAGAMSSGEVKKVDKEAGKLTIKHGPLENLDMPGMTMVFRVQDPAMLNDVKAGDKISFVAEKVGGAITVVRLERAP